MKIDYYCIEAIGDVYGSGTDKGMNETENGYYGRRDESELEDYSDEAKDDYYGFVNIDGDYW